MLVSMENALRHSPPWLQKSAHSILAVPEIQNPKEQLLRRCLSFVSQGRLYHLRQRGSASPDLLGRG